MSVLCAIVAVAVISCTPASSGAPGSPSPAPSLSPLAGSPVTPPPAINAVTAWDGVDNAPMLVSPVENLDLHRVGIGAWILTIRGWEPTATPPPVLTYERGFDHLVLAFDSTRHVQVLVSHTFEQPGVTQVSEWDGSAWRNVTTQHTPTMLGLGAYDPDLRALVGVDMVAPSQNRTWLYDGTDWRPAPGGVLSAGYYLDSIAYDPTRHAILVVNNAITFKYDGTSWSAIPLTPPTPIAYAEAFTFDSMRGDWIEFGGVEPNASGGFGAPTSQMWLGDGESWTQLKPSTAPAPRSGAHMVWDPGRQRAILFGGYFTSQQVFYSDTWQWNRKTWTKLFSAAPLASANQVPSVACTPSSSYGLMVVGGKLEILDTCGKVVSSAPVAASSVQTCTTGLNADTAPPVSASKDTVFYRDGDTKIRSLDLKGQTADVTTVPGGPTTVSMFSVSPDGQRIAVVVEDLSPADTINLRLYVEDLRGAGHHFDIYSTSLAKQGGKTLWPMGWHNGLLAMAVITACGQDPSTIAPDEWHLVDPATGDRKKTLRGNNCVLGLWPAPLGDTCTMYTAQTAVYDWDSSYLDGVLYGFGGQASQSGLSPSGKRVFVTSFTTTNNCNNSGSAGTCVAFGAGTLDDPRRYTFAERRFGCLWIDEDHVLASDAIIGIPSDQFPKSFYAPVVPLSSNGVCAGRLPGGL